MTMFLRDPQGAVDPPRVVQLDVDLSHHLTRYEPGQIVRVVVGATRRDGLFAAGPLTGDGAEGDQVVKTALAELFDAGCRPVVARVVVGDRNEAAAPPDSMRGFLNALAGQRYYGERLAYGRGLPGIEQIDRGYVLVGMLDSVLLRVAMTFSAEDARSTAGRWRWLGMMPSTVTVELGA